MLARTNLNTRRIAADANRVRTWRWNASSDSPKPHAEHRASFVGRSLMQDSLSDYCGWVIHHMVKVLDCGNAARLGGIGCARQSSPRGLPRLPQTPTFRTSSNEAVHAPTVRSVPSLSQYDSNHIDVRDCTAELAAREGAKISEPRPLEKQAAPEI